ncbi:hypothetical protein TNCV_4789871 [Trichonephila clavipes]|nr:hypothetical protein TNCV_4789871 [Trichonephila clavipes]
MVAERLARHHTAIATVDELWHRIEAAWASVPVHAIQSLFDSMPKSISAVIIARDLYRLKLAIDQKRPELANRRGVVFYQDNSRPHTSVVTRQKLWELGW